MHLLFLSTEQAEDWLQILYNAKKEEWGAKRPPINVEKNYIIAKKEKYIYIFILKKKQNKKKHKIQLNCSCPHLTCTASQRDYERT